MQNITITKDLLIDWMIVAVDYILRIGERFSDNPIQTILVVLWFMLIECVVLWFLAWVFWRK